MVNNKSKILKIIIRFVVTTSLLVYVFYNINIGNFIDTLVTINVSIYIAFAFLLLVQQLLAVFRWQLLLKAIDMNITYLSALRLTYIGFFCNNIMLGLTGGDVVKAFLASQKTDNKEKKVGVIVSVFVDRILGLAGLFLLAGIAVLPFINRYKEIFIPAIVIYSIIGCAIAGGLIYFSPIFRKAEWLKKIIPFQNIIKKIDSAILTYKEKKGYVIGAILISIACHLCSIIFYWGAARALGEKHSLVYFMSFIPLIILFQSLPISIWGLGVGEVAFQKMFGIIGIAANAAVAFSLLGRFAMFILSTPGGLFMALGTGNININEIESIVEADR